MPSDMLREMRLGVQRFWALRWLIKGPILAFLALMLVSGISAAITGGDSGQDGAVGAVPTTTTLVPSSTPTATVTRGPTATAAPTPTASPAAFITVSEPVDGDSVCGLDLTVTFRGSALPGATVKRGDQEIVTDDMGAWAMDVDVKEGENKVKFEIDGHKEAKQELKVTYCFPPNADEAEGYLVVLNDIVDPFSSDVCAAQPGNRLMAINVTVKNVSDGTQTVRYIAFQVRDTNGVQWEPYTSLVFGTEGLVACNSPTIPDLDLSGGGEITGWVSFEVRADSRINEVYYDPYTCLGIPGGGCKNDIHIAVD